ncbi:hypothetical protein D3C71_1369100 [compost metagenome]
MHLVEDNTPPNNTRCPSPINRQTGQVDVIITRIEEIGSKDAIYSRAGESTDVGGFCPITRNTHSWLQLHAARS